MPDKDIVFTDLSGETYVFSVTRKAPWWKRPISATERVNLTFMVRPLPFRELVFNETLLSKVDAGLREKGGFLDIAAVVKILFGESTQWLPKTATDSLWEAYQRLNYPKATPTAETKATPSVEEPSSVASIAGPSTSPESSSTT